MADNEKPPKSEPPQGEAPAEPGPDRPSLADTKGELKEFLGSDERREQRFPQKRHQDER
jgi:hypothetical protein